MVVGAVEVKGSTTKWICKINCRGGGTANQTVTEEWIIKTFNFNHRPFWIICWLRQKYHLPLLSLRSIRGQNPIFDLVAKYFKMYSGTIFYPKKYNSISTVWQFYQLSANWHTIELLSQLEQPTSFRIFQNCAKCPYFQFWELEYWAQAYLKLDQPTWSRLEPSKQVANVLRPSWLSPHQILKNMQKIVKNF